MVQDQVDLRIEISPQGLVSLEFQGPLDDLAYQHILQRLQPIVSKRVAPSRSNALAILQQVKSAYAQYAFMNAVFN